MTFNTEIRRIFKKEVKAPQKEEAIFFLQIILH